MAYPHLPVLLQEVLYSFTANKLHTFIDATLGAGGHAEALLKAHPEIVRYIGIDQDQSALAIASERLALWKEKTTFCHANFRDFHQIVSQLDLSQVDGILVDLGVSSMQLDQAERGFSFSKNGPLDMRMDKSSPLLAAEIVNDWPEKELGKIFRDWGEERQWRRAAQAIVVARKQKPIETTLELATILKPILPYNPKKGIHPLTLIFQALRIATNQELQTIELFLKQAFDHLVPGGRLAIISFHSLEDRLVKNQMRFLAEDKWNTSGIGGVFLDKTPVAKVITKKPVTATEEEIKSNPRSRSAKLRVAEKI